MKVDSNVIFSRSISLVTKFYFMRLFLSIALLEKRGKFADKFYIVFSWRCYCKEYGFNTICAVSFWGMLAANLAWDFVWVSHVWVSHVMASTTLRLLLASVECQTHKSIYGCVVLRMFVHTVVHAGRNIDDVGVGCE